MSSDPRIPWGKIIGVVVAALLLIFVLGLVIDACDVGNGYRKEGKRVVGVENVKEQNRAIIEDWNSMEAAAANACGAKDTKKDEDDPTLVEDPSLAYSAKYRQIRVDYNSRMANLYEAQAVRGLPLPSNLKSYPKVAPTLREMQTQVC